MPGAEREEHLPTVKELDVLAHCPLLCAFVIQSLPQRGTDEFREWVTEVQETAQKVHREWAASRGEASYINAFDIVLNVTYPQKLFHRSVRREEREGTISILLLIGYEVGTMKDLNLVRDLVVDRIIEDMEHIAPSTNVRVMNSRRGALHGIMNAGVNRRQRLPIIAQPNEIEEAIRALVDGGDVSQEILIKPLTPSSN